MWIFDPRFQYDICFGIENYKKYCKKNFLIESKDINEESTAVTISYPNCKLIVVVYLTPVKKRLTLDAISTMVHEATHVLDFVFEMAGEKKPGMECRAYLMSQLVESFLTKYLTLHPISKP